MKSTYPRIHIIPSQDGRRAIVLVRSRRHTCTYGWNLETHEFQFGQCLKARLYEYRSDLSPNGQYFLYGAYEGRPVKQVYGMYAALSKAPYLKALDLYQNIESRGGGGYFKNNHSYQLSEVFFNQTKFVRKESQLTCLNTGEEHCLLGGVGVYVRRLRRLGWQDDGLTQTGGLGVGFLTLTKKSHDGLELRKTIHINSDTANKPVEWEENQLLYLGSKSIRASAWPWADFIGGTLYWVCGAQLYSAAVSLEALAGERGLEETLVYNFDQTEFKEAAAPV